MTDTPNTTQGKGAFQVGDKVRYIGPERVGLTQGAIYDCIRVGSFNTPIHFDDDGNVRDRTENDYELVSRAEHPTPTQYAPELVERMVALCRSAQKLPKFSYPPGHAIGAFFNELDAIVSDLPQEVDPDLILARRSAANIGIDGYLWKQIAEGMCDDQPLVLGLKSGIALGRQLERGYEA